MEDPQLWRWAVIRVKAGSLREVLTSNRIRAVRSLEYDGGGEDPGNTTDNLKLILNILLKSDFVLMDLELKVSLPGVHQGLQA